MSPIRFIAEALRRWWWRRTARKLLSEGLPRGVSGAQLEPALRFPPPFEPPANEFWGLPFGADIIRGRAPRRLLRLAALPCPARDVGVVRVTSFRLDADLRVPAETDPVRVASDAQQLVRRPRMPPRMPLARAPLARLTPRNFRLDGSSFAPANEAILPLPRHDPALRWINPALRREKVDLPWMAQDRIRFLAPTQAEWFAMWWEQSGTHAGGARSPRSYELPRELGWAMEHCKEQMLIRRDVKKDEAAPDPQKLEPNDVGPGMAAAESVPLTEMIPEKTWVEPARMLGPLPWENATREAWLRRRTLLHALEDR